MTKSQFPMNDQSLNAQLGFRDLGFDWSLDIRAWGFHLVPRDDRLFDAFPEFTRHRGIELWEKWNDSEIELVAVKFQDPKSKPQIMKLPRPQLEKALLHATVFT